MSMLKGSLVAAMMASVTGMTCADNDNGHDKNKTAFQIVKGELPVLGDND